MLPPGEAESLTPMVRNYAIPSRTVRSAGSITLIVALRIPAKVSMCLAFPGRVLSIDGDFAKVDFGEGTVREGVNVSLVEVKPEEYVLVHAGYAIQVMDEKEAQKTLSYWREILAYEQESGSIGR